MSMTLTFHESVWASARSLAQSGRTIPALQALAPLLHSEQAPRNLRILAFRLAARLELDREQYVRARNYLRAAIRISPNDAELHYELGFAFENDPYGCDLRAARRYRRATVLQPRNAKYAAAFGRTLVHLNRVRAGVKRLREAAILAPNDVLVIQAVVTALCEAGCPKSARRILLTARFRSPHNRELQQLWTMVRYELAKKRPRREPSRAPGKVLPFLHLVGEATPRVVRRDARSTPAPHFHRLRAFRSEQG